MEELISPPLEWTEKHPDFEVPEWDSLDYARVAPQNASRHFFVLGETGSGKTRSAVMPLIRTAFHYPSEAAYQRYAAAAAADGETPEDRLDLHPCMLVIDPKQDLYEYIQTLTADAGLDNNGDPLREVISINLREKKHLLWLFEGSDASQLNPSEVIDRLFSLSAYIEREKRQTRDPFWAQQASGIIRALIAIDHHLFQQRGVAALREFWRDVHNEVNRLLATSPEANRIQDQFNRTYDKFMAAADEVQSGANRLLMLLREEAFQALVTTLNEQVYTLTSTQDGQERARAYQKLSEVIKDITERCQAGAQTGTLTEQELKPRMDFISSGQQFTRLGETLLNWNTTTSSATNRPAAVLRETLNYDRDCYLRPIYTLFNLSTVYRRDNGGDPVLEGYLNICQRHLVPSAMLVRLRSLPQLAQNTYTSITAVINGFLEELASSDLADYVSINPYEAPDPARFISVEDRLNMGDCVVYSPGSDSDLANLIGRCIKMKFFELSFNRRDRMRPFFYICDEFQRYITADKVSGEQSFLDRCRAYRVVCVLATQSLSSLSYRLSSMNIEGDREASLEVLLNNSGNKLFFRGTDTRTHFWIKAVMPDPYVHGKPHIIAVRPLSTLSPGECYYLFSTGHYGRSQVILHTDETASRLRRARADEAQRRFEAVQAALHTELGADWVLDFKPMRSYQQAWKPNWKQQDVWVHYEFSFNLEDLMDAQERFEVVVHVERRDRRLFLERFTRRQRRLAPAYHQNGVTFLPSSNRAVVLARKRYAFNALTDDFLTPFVKAVRDFQFLPLVIDELLAKLHEPEEIETSDEEEDTPPPSLNPFRPPFAPRPFGTTGGSPFGKPLPPRPPAPPSDSTGETDSANGETPAAQTPETSPTGEPVNGSAPQGDDQAPKEDSTSSVNGDTATNAAPVPEDTSDAQSSSVPEDEQSDG